MMDSTLAQMIGHLVEVEMKNQQLELEKSELEEKVHALEAAIVANLENKNKKN